MHKGKAETAAGWEQVSDLEAEDLAEVGKLRSAVSVQFDKNNREHHALLCELYVAAFPEKRCALALGNCVAEEWTDLGFQTDNPATDFRGAGVIGLRVLVYIVRHEPELVAEAQSRLDLFAACTLSLVQALAVHLKLYNDLDPIKHLDPSRPSVATHVPRRRRTAAGRLGLSRKAFKVGTSSSKQQHRKVRTNSRTDSDSPSVSMDIPGLDSPIPAIEPCRDSKAVAKCRAQLSKPANVQGALHSFGCLVSASHDAVETLAQLTVVTWVNVLLNLGEAKHESMIELMRFSNALQRARENVMIALLECPASLDELAACAHALAHPPSLDSGDIPQAGVKQSQRRATGGRGWFKRSAKSGPPTRRRRETTTNAE